MPLMFGNFYLYVLKYMLNAFRLLYIIHSTVLIMRVSCLVIENRLGFLNTAFGIYFYVQRHGNLVAAKDDVIRFNKKRFNILEEQ